MDEDIINKSSRSKVKVAACCNLRVLILDGNDLIDRE